MCGTLSCHVMWSNLRRQLFSMPAVNCLRLAGVHQAYIRQDNCFINLQFGLETESLSLPDIIVESASSSMWIVKVRELIHGLESLTLDYDCWLNVLLLRGWLEHGFGFLRLSMLRCISGTEPALKAQSSANRRSRTLSSFTLGLAWSLHRLKRLPSVRYRIEIPSSLSWKASVSMTANIMLNSLGASTQACLTLRQQELGQAFHRGMTVPGL